MKPGRELDALVAEKVMGWTEVCGYEGEYKGYWKILPKYSTDIAAAWAVVELPLFDGWAIGRNASGKWEVFNPWENNFVVSVADTAPHAICLAALKAVGYEA